MKWLVNGEESALPVAEGASVVPSGGILRVNSTRGSGSAVAVKHGDTTYVSYQGQVYEVKKKPPVGSAHQAATSAEARAPMPGMIVEVCVAVGDVVHTGSKLMVLEAMKMQQPILAGMDGTVKLIGAAVGDQVSDSDLLVQIAPPSEEA
jgi:acetyl/propionyl-CoA carboxylase alpha subunit